MVERHGLDHGLAQALGHRAGFVAGRDRGQGQKLVAALARDELALAQGSLHAFGDDAQKLVADRVAVQVVDLLEPIQVQGEQGQALALGRRLLLARQPLQEGGSVRQAGQAVVAGQVGDATFLGHAGAQVAHGVDHGAAARRQVATGRQFDGNLLAAGHQDGLGHSAVVETVGVLHPIPQIGADQAVTVGAGQLGQDFVDGHDDAVAFDRHAVDAGLEQVLQPLAVQRQGFPIQGVAGAAGAQHQQTDAGDAQRQHMARVLARQHAVQRSQRNDGHRRHGREVQADDAQHHGRPALQPREAFFGRGQAEGQGAERHRTDNGDRQIDGRPMHHALDRQGGHADEVHPGHSHAEQGAARLDGETAAHGGRRQGQADAQDRHRQGDARQHRLIGRLDARSIGDHGHEMGAPDGRSARDGAQEQPRHTRQSPVFTNAPQQSCCDEAAQQADQGSQGDEPQMVLVSQTGQDTHGRRRRE